MYTCVIFISEKLESNKGPPLPVPLVSLSDCLSLQSNCCLGRNVLSTGKKKKKNKTTEGKFGGNGPSLTVLIARSDLGLFK